MLGLETIKSSFIQKLILNNVYNEDFLADLPDALKVASDWLDERPTIKSTYESSDGLKTLKYHFLMVYRRYVVGAEEEIIELSMAENEENKIEELGDVTFYLLHIFRVVGLNTDFFKESILKEKPSSSESVKDFLSLFRIMVGEWILLQTVREMKYFLKKSHMLLFGGPMSFGDQKTDAPWLNDRDSDEWINFKKEISYYWFLSFISVMHLANKMDVDILSLTNMTSEKADRNFPKEFFNPEFSWFTSVFNGDNYDVECCRLFRKEKDASGISYLDIFYLQREKQEFTSKSFKIFVIKCLEEIVLDSKTNNRAQKLLDMINFIQSEN